MALIYIPKQFHQLPFFCEILVFLINFGFIINDWIKTDSYFSVRNTHIPRG